jgi:hypothetical protein
MAGVSLGRSHCGAIMSELMPKPDFESCAAEAYDSPQRQILESCEKGPLITLASSVSPRSQRRNAKTASASCRHFSCLDLL